MPKYHNLRSAYFHKVCGSKNYDENDDEEYEYYTPSPTVSPKTFVHNTISTVCNIGQYIPLETCQLYYAPTRGVISFCANLTNPYKDQFIFTLFSWNSCEVDSQDQRLWSMYLKNKNPITSEFQPVKTEDPYKYGTFPITSDWSHYRLESENVSTNYWIVFREYNLSSNQPTFFPPQPQPTEVANKMCTPSVIKQNCFEPTGSPSSQFGETGSPSNPPTPMSSCGNESPSPSSTPMNGFLFFVAPKLSSQNGYECNSCNLTFSDTDVSMYNAMKTAGQVSSTTRRIDYNNIINLCNVTTTNKNTTLNCNGICKWKPEPPTEKPTPTLPPTDQVRNKVKSYKKK